MRQSEFKEIANEHKKWLESTGKVGRQANFSKVDLHEVLFEEEDFSYAIFKNCNLTGAKIINTKFVGVDLSNADLTFADIINSDFSHANLSKANFEGATLLNLNFNYVNLNGTKLLGIRSDNIDFSFAEGKNTIFSKSELVRSIFRKCVLDCPKFLDVNVTKAIFEETQIIDANMGNLIGVVSKYDVQIIDSKELKEIVHSQHIKLLRTVGKVFMFLSLFFVSSIMLVGVYNFFTLGLMQINFLSSVPWILFSLFFAFIGIASYYIMHNIRMKDRLVLKENHEKI